MKRILTTSPSLFFIEHSAVLVMLTPPGFKFKCFVIYINVIYINDAASPRRLKLSRFAAFLPLLAGRLPPLPPPALLFRGEEAAGAGAEGAATVVDTPPAGPPGVP